MRHLSVPSLETQDWLKRCREQGWLYPAGVISLAEGRRGIPLVESAPDENDPFWDGHPHVDLDGREKNLQHWKERLPSHLQNLPAEIWPSSYEIQGDVLMVKMDDKARAYETDIALAMLAQLNNVRIVCADEGVEGDFRIRHLRILASRDGSTSTTTQIKEHGHSMWVDPSSVYFSARLSTQRHETLQKIQQFRRKRAEPLIIADPYAGVGPSFPLLLQDEGLVAGYLAGDLNPKAVELLQQNFAAWTQNKSFSPSTIVCMDAREWQHNPDFRSLADVLLINLPHDSFDHIPALLPLFRRDREVMLRGWAIIERATLAGRHGQLQTLISQAGGHLMDVSVQEVKGFSTHRCFVVFDAIIAWG